MTEGRKIVIVGSGSHARVVFDILRAAGREADVAAFVDAEGKGEMAGQTIFGRQVLPNMAAFEEYARANAVAAVIGHGNNSRRKDLLPHLESLGVEIISAVHPSAVISPDAEIGLCSTVSAGAIILTNAKIGRGVIVNTAATVDHDCQVGDFSQVAPGAHLAGHVRVGSECFVGIGAVVIQNITVGDKAVIGAGAAVVRDVPAECLVIGVPARVRKKFGA